MQGFFQKIAQSKLVVAIVNLLFGIILIVWRMGAVFELSRALGIVLIVCSIIGIGSYLFGRKGKGTPPPSHPRFWGSSSG